MEPIGLTFGHHVGSRLASDRAPSQQSGHRGIARVALQREDLGRCRERRDVRLRESAAVRGRVAVVVLTRALHRSTTRTRADWESGLKRAAKATRGLEALTAGGGVRSPS
jgi:hypothetical protein